MRIELDGIIASATGPFGGDNRKWRLATLQDGSIIMQRRKNTMTGDRTHPTHALMKLAWIFVDQCWKALPHERRIEWGKCLKRSTDHARSNLDEFRAINIPRVALGMPLINSPPDRFHSRCVYLQRTP